MESFKTKILPAILAGSALVAVAYYADQKRPDPVATANAFEVTRKHIPVQDSNEDGVPDWQAQVIGTDPIYLETESTGVYEPSDTVTGRIAYEVMTDQNIDPDSNYYHILKDIHARKYIKQLLDETKEPIYTADDLVNIIETNDKDALHAYGNLVGGIIYYHQDDSGVLERDVFDRYVRDKNPKHLETLAGIEGQYQAIIDELLVLETPSQYVDQHLAIVNAFSALRHDVYAMQIYFEDPLFTTTRLGRYDNDVMDVSRSIIGLYNALYLVEKITFEPNETLRYWADNLR